MLLSLPWHPGSKELHLQPTYDKLDKRLAQHDSYLVHCIISTSCLKFFGEPSKISYANKYLYIFIYLPIICFYVYIYIVIQPSLPSNTQNLLPVAAFRQLPKTEIYFVLEDQVNKNQVLMSLCPSPHNSLSVPSSIFPLSNFNQILLFRSVVATVFIFQVHVPILLVSLGVLFPPLCGLAGAVRLGAHPLYHGSDLVVTQNGIPIPILH